MNRHIPALRARAAIGFMAAGACFAYAVGKGRHEWLLVSARVLRAHRGYGSATVEIWDQARNLIAFGNQTMLFRGAPKKGEP